MTRLLIGILLATWSLAVPAQDWNMHWIRAASTCPTEQLWFKRSFNFNTMPTEVFVEVASGGRFILYVNGLNVTTQLFEPGRAEDSNTICVVRYDVLPFIQRGSNTIAVWYSPLPTNKTTAGAAAATKAPKQLSLELFGKAAGLKFAHFTDETWTCMSAFAHTMSNGDEMIDGRYHINGNATPTAFMKRVERLNNYVASTVDSRQRVGLPMRVNLIHNCHLWEDTHLPVLLPDSIVNTASDSSSVAANDSLKKNVTNIAVSQKRRLAVGCGAQFWGRVRVTLQKMTAGDTLHINGLHYVCNGKDEEQVCRRFTMGEAGFVEMEVPYYLSSDKIVSVEAMDVLLPDSHYVRPYAEDRNSHQPDETTVFYDNDEDEEEDNSETDNTTNSVNNE